MTLAAGSQTPADQTSNTGGSPEAGDGLQVCLIQGLSNVIEESDNFHLSPLLSTVLASSSGWLLRPE